MPNLDLPVIDYKGRKTANGYKKGFSEKSPDVQKLIREALHIVQALGIPTDDLTDIRKEKIAMALLAVGDVKTTKDWAKIKDANKTYAVEEEGLPFEKRRDYRVFQIGLSFQVMKKASSHKLEMQFLLCLHIILRYL